jgi:hypothetical protein
MNRTGIVACALLLLASPAAVAQQPAPASAAKAQADRVDELVRGMRAAEARLRSIELELGSTVRLHPDVVVTTTGTLRVLRGEQAALHTRLEYRTADGQRGRVESAQTATGIEMLQDDAMFGETFVHVDPALVADLEWAGRVLQRDDLPGMLPQARGPAGVRHADAPLGSALLAALQRHFVLAVDGRTEHGGEPGTWLAGPRKPGLDPQDPDLPLADRAEAFVRTRDHALLLLRQFVGDDVVQELAMTKVEVDADLPPALFEVDGGGQRPRPVQQDKPMARQIEQALLEAEATRLPAWHAAVATWAVRGGPPLFLLAVRPSKR